MLINKITTQINIHMQQLKDDLNLHVKMLSAIELSQDDRLVIETRIKSIALHLTQISEWAYCLNEIQA